MKYLYVHVPKTAGKSFYSLIKKNFGGWKGYYAYLEKAHEEGYTTKEFLDSTPIFLGHVSVKWAKQHCDDFQVITTVREIADWWISWFFWEKREVRYDPTPPCARTLRARKGIDVYFEHEIGDNRLVSRFGDGLKEAKETLDNAALVGLFERLNETKNRLVKLLDLEKTEMPHQNLGRDRQKGEIIDPSWYEAIRRRCPNDVELYEHAKQLFDK